MKKLSKEMNLDLKDVDNPYLYETLFHGRVGSKMENFRDWNESFIKEIDTKAKSLKIKSDDLSNEVSDYLYFRHAPERNARLGDGAAGISTKDAEIGLKELTSKEYGDDIVKLAEEMQDLNRETLDILLDSDVISKETYDTLTKTYKNHVPLYRILDDDDNLQGLANKAFDVKTSGIRKAKGSRREVADVFSNIISNYENAIVKAEKNVVGKSILKFAEKPRSFAAA